MKQVQFQARARCPRSKEGARSEGAPPSNDCGAGLLPTLVRFDAVYHGHFKCNLRRLVDYPNLWAHTRRLYAMPGIAETVFLDHIKRHYYGSHAIVNPTRVVPAGPEISFA